ncbi:hypothetical protein JX266_011183 [Neoarthrinium moseri]|nr:hypothetical protein JX266_011183 [Neoarthrinium moseri]
MLEKNRGIAQLAAEAPRLDFTCLFQAFISNGHYPAPFKATEVVIIPKPGKKEYSDPGTYRPTSLLSCLGKGLERLLARRMAWTVIQSGILAPQHFKALPKRPPTDLVMALILDIEQALNQGLVATLVTANVKRAFDVADEGPRPQSLPQKTLFGEIFVRYKPSGDNGLITKYLAQNGQKITRIKDSRKVTQGDGVVNAEAKGHMKKEKIVNDNSEQPHQD